ncbi:MAG: phosphatase PAP2 family protein [Oscillospiraceae bacterium]|jgi:membrane-associated phospholipid phosphatase
MSLWELDSAVVLWMQSVRQPWLDPIMKALSILGDAGAVWIAISLLLLFFKRYRRTGLLALISLAFCFAIANLMMKNLVARPRPYDAIPGLTILVKRLSDYSFPSGHACSSFAAAPALSEGTGRSWGFLFISMALLISVSRLYVGVHYPSDIIAGAAVGILGGAFIRWLLRRKVPWFN